jgi:tetratricopeptide (TPR) repeat protein
VDCQRILDEDVGVRYLRGELNEEEQAAFEHHYFGCVLCFERLQALEAAAAGLQATAEHSKATGREAARRRPAISAILPMAAAVFVALSAGILIRQIGQGRPSPSPSAVGTASPDAPSSSLASPRAHSVEELARFDPPPYTALTVRGNGDQAEAAFQQAMERYSDKDYARALPGLRKAAGLQPRRADFLFYLGVAELLAGEVDPAVADLRRAAEQGQPGYSEPAHFYLAMAYLRLGDLARARARAELALVAKSKAPQAAEARRRLAALDDGEDEAPPRR